MKQNTREMAKQVSDSLTIYAGLLIIMFTVLTLVVYAGNIPLAILIGTGTILVTMTILAVWQLRVIELLLINKRR